MTAKELIDAGFKEFDNKGPIWAFDKFYQLRVRDQYGTRYFVEVNCFLPKNGRDYTAWEVEINFGKGFSFTDGSASMRIIGWDVGHWTPQKVKDWADELWHRLNPKYYERD